MAIDRRYHKGTRAKTFIIEKMDGVFEEWIFNRKNQVCSVFKKSFITSVASSIVGSNQEDGSRKMATLSDQIQETKDKTMVVFPLI